VALVLAAVLVAAGAYYWLRVRYVPTAHRHVPSDTSLAVRADAASIVLFKPVRQHLWPLVTKRRDEPSAGPGEPTPKERERLEHIAELTGVRLPHDLREVIVASVDATSWVVLVGGTFRRGRFVEGVDQWLREEGIGGWRREDELLVHLLGPTIGQANDGTLVLGTNAAIVRAALPAESSTDATPLPVEGALSFRATAQAWRGALRLLPGSLPGLGTLSRVERASGSFTLSEEPHVRLSLAPAPGVEVAALRNEAAEWLLAARAFLLLVPGDLGGAKQAVRSAAVEVRQGEVEVTAAWPYDSLERAIAELARRLAGEPAAAPTGDHGWSLF
jgi:hypothetical protein